MRKWPLAAAAAAAVLLAGVVLLVGPRHASLPRYVAGPASGLVHECQQAGQGEPRPDALVATLPDFDGDGLADHAIDTGRGCEAVRLLYCNDVGCSVDFYASSQSGIVGGWKARRVDVDRTGHPAIIKLGTAGSGCGLPTGEACTLTLHWNGAELEPLK